MRKKTKKNGGLRFGFKTPSQKGMAIGLGVLAIGAGYLGYHGLQMHRMNQVVGNLSQLAQAIPGVQVQVVGKAIFIAGEVSSAQDWAKTRAMAATIKVSGTGIAVGNLAKMTEAAKQAVVAQLKKEIRNRRIRVRSVGERFVLEGNPRSDFEADRAVEIAKGVLFLDTNSPTRSTAGAAENDIGSVDAFSPVILDMMKLPE